MKVLKDFSAFANIKGRLASLTIMLALLSLLYCTTYIMVNSIAFRFGIAMYYAITYGFALLAAYVYMIVIFMFIRNKRMDKQTLVMKSYLLPLLSVQTIFFVAMAGSSFLSIQFLMQKIDSVWYYPLTVCIILATLFYIPMQVFACIYIYDGYKNPFRIIKQSFLTIKRHFISCFYILLLLAVIGGGYRVLLAILSEYPFTFVANIAVIEIMTHSNPFMIAFELGMNVTGNAQFIVPVLLSLLYAIVMCIALVYYYSCMVCIYDNDIRV